MVEYDKIKRSVSISSGISSFTVPGSGAMSSIDAGDNSVNESLRFNSGDLVNGDSGNDLWNQKFCIGAGGYVMVGVDSGDSGNGGSVTMKVDV